MTPDEHRTIGRILGFPDCCVEAWVNGGRPAAEYGFVAERYRSDDEIRRLHAELQATGIPFVLSSPGWSLKGMLSGDRRKCYVPCDAHIGAPGYEAPE